MQHSKIVQANSKGPKSSKIALWKNDAPFHTFPMSCQICSSPPPSFQLSWGPLKACPRHSLLIMKDIIMRPNETSREPKSSSFLFKIPPKCVCVCVVSVKLLVVSYLRNKKSRWARSVGDIVCETARLRSTRGLISTTFCSSHTKRLGTPPKKT